MAGFTVADADAYERNIGRWSRALAPQVAQFCAPLSGDVLEVGCGTGILTGQLLAQDGVHTVTATDIADDLLERARRDIVDPRVTFRRVDAAALPFADATFDAVVSSLVVNFIDDPAAAVEQMRRVARPGATIAAAIWDFRGGMPHQKMLFDIASAFDPEAGRRRDAFMGAAIYRHDGLARLWAQAGLDDIRYTPLHVNLEFRDFADFFVPATTSGQGFSRYWAKVDPALQARIRACLEAAWRAGDEDGPRAVVARAYAVRAHVPK